MINTTQENLLYLSSTFSKLLKRRFGKGPETCYVILKGNRIYVYMRNFITPAEESLINNDEVDLAAKFRSTVINIIIKEFILEVSKVLGSSFDHFLHDWNYEKNTGILLLENTRSNHEAKIDIIIKNTLFKLIEDVGSHYHKKLLP